MPRNNPPVRKGVRFPFQVSVVAWMDLLGYGAMISAARFNPLHPQAAEAIKRLRLFHRIVAEHSDSKFPTLVMNDGAAAYRDLSMRSRSVTFDFVARCWKLYQAIQSTERAAGYPGVRVVVATGFRMRGRRAGSDAADAKLKSLLNRFKAGEVDTDQALMEAATVRPTFDIIPQLQANFAFTKAYVAENSGSGAGLGGPNFFLDRAVLSVSDESWLDVAANIDWVHEALGMRATFALVSGIRKRSGGSDGANGVRSGLEVAQLLADDPDVLTALRNAIKP